MVIYKLPEYAINTRCSWGTYNYL